MTLAEVLATAGRPDDARDALKEALGLYERKGNLVSAEHTRALVGELAALAEQTS